MKHYLVFGRYEEKSGKCIWRLARLTRDFKIDLKFGYFCFDFRDFETVRAWSALDSFYDVCNGEVVLSLEQLSRFFNCSFIKKIKDFEVSKLNLSEVKNEI